VRLHHGDLSALLAELAREREAQRSGGGRQSEPRGDTKGGAARGGDTEAAKGKAKRLSNWEEKELRQIEQRIAGLELEVADLDKRLAEPDLYTGPRAELEKVRASRAKKGADVAALYARWEELESMRG
jgi:ATP-binding cassette subfamily F protein uup